MKCSSCSAELRPVVVADIDGTLAVYHDAVTKFNSRYFDMAPPTFPYDGSEPFRDYLGITQAQHREMKLAFRQGGNKRFLKPYPGAVKFANDVRWLGCEFWVATTRPWQRLDNIDPDTREWLRRHGIEIDGLLFGEDKYQQLVDRVDQARIIACVEDLKEQMLAGQALGLPMIQVARPHNYATKMEPRVSLFVATGMVEESARQWRLRHGQS